MQLILDTKLLKAGLAYNQVLSENKFQISKPATNTESTKMVCDDAFTLRRLKKLLLVRKLHQPCFPKFQ
jgi:hypothetical protein